MKRCLIILMTIGLVAGSMSTAGAKKAKRQRVERTVEASYGPYPAPVTGCSSVLGPWACLLVKTRPNEDFFTAKVTDVHGQPVFVQVYAYGQKLADFCGETREPIPFPPRAELSFYVVLPVFFEAAPLDCPANSIKTTGTISVTVSNLR